MSGPCNTATTTNAKQTHCALLCTWNRANPTGTGVHTGFQLRGVLYNEKGHAFPAIIGVFNDKMCMFIF